jgi:hypothetical protein
MRKRIELDETGQTFEITVPFPIWVKPKAKGDAPMCTALYWAREIAEQWVAEHPNNYPPIVINITSGIPSDGDFIKPAHQVHQVGTTNGQTLLYNFYIAESNESPVTYPASEQELPNDYYANQLFSISSVIPETSRNLLQSFIGKLVPKAARGLVFNGDASSLRMMFPFIDMPASLPLDPNR